MTHLYADPTDLAAELSQIPPEYQETFRQTIAQELTELEQNQTDSDILHYLRQRREAFRRGGYIRPDGRHGLLDLPPEALYEQALPALARQQRAAAHHPRWSRPTLVKVGLLAGAALIFLFMLLRGRIERLEQDAVTPTPLPAADATLTVMPTPPLPDIEGSAGALQTIGSLGGALTLGRPSLLELHYAQSEETLALPIDPSQPTTRGELRYNAAVMASDSPVAVWLWGTVLNYALGIPDNLVRPLAIGDRLTLRTDTGAALSFIISEAGRAHYYDSGRLFSQNRLGLTLFALPAAAADDVAYARARYDFSAETASAASSYHVGESFPFGQDAVWQVLTVQSSQETEGTIRIVIKGEIKNATLPLNTETILLSLYTNTEQTAAIPLKIDAAGAWEAIFRFPTTAAGQPLWVELRTTASGDLARVALGDIPHPLDHLQIETPVAVWDAPTGTALLFFHLHNVGEGGIYLTPDFIQYPLTEGGDAHVMNGQVTPRLPLWLQPGETARLNVTFRPLTSSVQMQIGADLWQITGFPLP